MATSIIEGDVTLLISSAPSTESPDAAYAAWEAALGVTDATNTVLADADDSLFQIDLAAPALAGSETKASFCSEGGFGLYRSVTTTTLSTRTTTALTGVSRMFIPPQFPILEWTFHPQTDCRCIGVRTQKVGTTTIIAGRICRYTDNTYALDFAIKLVGNTHYDFVFSAVDQPVPFCLFGVAAPTETWSASVDAGTQVAFSIDVSDAWVPPVYYGFLALELVVETTGAAPLLQGATLDQGYLQGRNYTPGTSEWGNGRINGTVKEVGTPEHAVRRRVRLHRMIDGMLVREVWSDPVTGAYEFNNIDPAYKFYVVSHDHVLNYNAVIKDNLAPEPMP